MEHRPKLLPFGIMMALVVVACAGCTGTGTPARPRELTALSALAQDQLTALKFLKQWLPILYPEPVRHGDCEPDFSILPPEPGDEQGSIRYRIRSSSCTVIVGFQGADGAGHEVARDTEGRERHLTWGVAVPGDPFWTQAVEQTFWDGARMEYEIGDDPVSTGLDHYYRGALIRPDGEQMGLSHDRNIYRDLLALTVPDEGALQVEVPLAGPDDTGFRRVFDRPTTGTYAGDRTEAISLEFTSSSGTHWDHLEVHTVDGVVGSFAITEDLAGSGVFRMGSKLLASFRWDAQPSGTLEPMGLAAYNTTPSVATWDFAIDRWIRHAAELGPSPYY